MIEEQQQQEEEEKEEEGRMVEMPHGGTSTRLRHDDIPYMKPGASAVHAKLAPRVGTSCHSATVPVYACMCAIIGVRADKSCVCGQ